VPERREIYTGIWCEILKERDYMEIPAVDVRIILKCMLNWYGTGFICCRRGTCRGLF
jgi:hypothetical protein